MNADKIFLKYKDINHVWAVVLRKIIDYVTWINSFEIAFGHEKFIRYRSVLFSWDRLLAGNIEDLRSSENI